MAGKNKTNNEPIEKLLWKTADKLRKNIDAAEYKHVVMGALLKTNHLKKYRNKKNTLLQNLPKKIVNEFLDFLGTD